MAAVVFFCMCYLDKKMSERKLRNSNKWIQGIEAAVGFLWVVFPIASKERMNICAIVFLPSRRDVVQSGFRFELLQCIITYITINITDRREGYL